MDPPTSVPPAANGSCALQLRAAAFAFPEAPCDIQVQDSGFGDLQQPQQQQQQHYGDRMASSSGYCATTGLENGGGSGYSAPLSPPQSALPLPWCHGLSSDADYYGPGMVGVPANLPPTPTPHQPAALQCMLLYCISLSAKANPSISAHRVIFQQGKSRRNPLPPQAT